MFAFLIYKLGAFLAKSTSLPTARRSATVVGRLMCFLQRRNRRILLRNLEVAFGSELSRAELKRLRRRIFQNFAVFVIDFLRLPLVNTGNIKDFLTEGSLEGMSRLSRLAGPESRVITTTPHLGNWELGAAVTGLLSGPVYVLVDAHPSPFVTSFFNDRRADKGLRVVPVTSFHLCFRAIKEGTLVAIVGDRPVTGQGIRVNYFGREALMPDGYALLARRFGASIVPAFLVMSESGKYRFLMDDPIRPNVTDDPAADVRDCVQRVAAVFERYIREYPDQWYVFRPIWDGPATAAQDRQRWRILRRSARLTPAADAVKPAPSSLARPTP
jgi:lauroyl/myristoyl acyltransferase